MDEKAIREMQDNDDNILRVLALCWESAKHQPQNIGRRRALIESAIKKQLAAISQKAEAPDLRGVDGGDVDEWIDLIRHAKVPRATVLIRAADAPLAMTPYEQRKKATP